MKVLPLWIIALAIVAFVVFSIDRSMKADEAAALARSRKEYAEKVKAAFYVIQDKKMYVNGIGSDPRKDRVMIGLDGKSPSLLLGTDNFWTVTGIASRPGWRVLNHTNR
jgi:uncharacterized protein (DUF934 family)